MLKYIKNIKMEPKIIDYYQSDLDCMRVIENLNNEYHKLEEKHNKVKEELEFYKSAFKYPHSNSVVYNLLIVKKNGKPVWIDRIKTYEHDLKSFDQCPIIKDLIKNSNPRCER